LGNIAVQATYVEKNVLNLLQGCHTQWHELFCEAQLD